MLWVAVTLLTAPERLAELLENFYRRARPLGNWRLFTHASAVPGSLPVAGEWQSPSAEPRP